MSTLHDCSCAACGWEGFVGQLEPADPMFEGGVVCPQCGSDAILGEDDEIILEPCPHCGREELQLTGSDGMWPISIECSTCATMMWFYVGTVAEAAQRWNRRHLLSEGIHERRS